MFFWRRDGDAAVTEKLWRFLPSRLGCLGERRELPQRGPGRSLGRNQIWRNL